MLVKRLKFITRKVRKGKAQKVRKENKRKTSGRAS